MNFCFAVLFLFGGLTIESEIRIMTYIVSKHLCTYACGCLHNTCLGSLLLEIESSNESDGTTFFHLLSQNHEADNADDSAVLVIEDRLITG